MRDIKLDKDEQVITIFYRHIFAIVPIIASTVLVLIGTVVGFSVLVTNAGEIGRIVPVGLASGLLLVLAALSAAILIASLFINRQNRIILTNKHVLQVAQESLFNRAVSHLTLDRVQDVQGTRSGIWATILNFGELEIETAGADKNFIFQYCPNPSRSAEAISETHEKYFPEKPDHSHKDA